MKATHTDYLHPKHLRVEDGNRVLCMSPSAKAYEGLNRKGLPSWSAERDRK